MILKALFRRLSGVLCLLALFAPLAARAALTEDDFKQWSLLAVQDEGRIKPLDTFSRETLLRLTGGSFPRHGRLQGCAGQGLATERFSRFRAPERRRVARLEKGAAGARRLPPADPRSSAWTPRANAFPSMSSPHLADAGSDGPRHPRPAFPGGRSAAQPRAAGGRKRQRPADAVQNPAGRRGFSGRAASRLDRAPPAAPTAEAGPAAARRTAWLTPSDEAKDAYGAERFAPAEAALGDTLRAYQAGDGYQFNLHARELRGDLRALNPARYPTDSALELEHTYNHLGGVSVGVVPLRGGGGRLDGGRRRKMARPAMGGAGGGFCRADDARRRHRAAFRGGGPPAGDEHVRVDDLGGLRGDRARVRLLRGLPGHDLPARRVASRVLAAAAGPAIARRRARHD